MIHKEFVNLKKEFPDHAYDNIINSVTHMTRTNFFTVGGYWIGVVMILPQVHLRKPCYDFSFL